ncbi:hypothetical protein LIER_31049 [Lithospermum erythrorhizon]|uniref:Retrotransposon gag domain-containing protein n=1 Tax=Lithospermum erythrorhizon TaxID=34254 RepID=A0AAV3RPP3_LITER
MPRGFRMPKFKISSGIGDPSNHLKSFDSQLSFWANDDEVYARAFPSSLSGQALKWFHKLPPNFIDYCDGDLILPRIETRTVKEEISIGATGNKKCVVKVGHPIHQAGRSELLSEEMTDAKARGKKPIDEWQYGSPKKEECGIVCKNPKTTYLLKGHAYGHLDEMTGGP